MGNQVHDTRPEPPQSDAAVLMGRWLEQDREYQGLVLEASVAFHAREEAGARADATAAELADAVFGEVFVGADCLVTYGGEVYKVTRWDRGRVRVEKLAVYRLG